MFLQQVQMRALSLKRWSLRQNSIQGNFISLMEQSFCLLASSLTLARQNLILLPFWSQKMETMALRRPPIRLLLIRKMLFSSRQSRLLEFSEQRFSFCEQKARTRLFLNCFWMLTVSAPSKMRSSCLKRLSSLTSRYLMTVMARSRMAKEKTSSLNSLQSFSSRVASSFLLSLSRESRSERQKEKVTRRGSRASPPSSSSISQILPSETYKMYLLVSLSQILLSRSKSSPFRKSSSCGHCRAMLGFTARPLLFMSLPSWKLRLMSSLLEADLRLGWAWRGRRSSNSLEGCDLRARDISRWKILSLSSKNSLKQQSFRKATKLPIRSSMCMRSSQQCTSNRNSFEKLLHSARCAARPSPSPNSPRTTSSSARGWLSAKRAARWSGRRQRTMERVRPMLQVRCWAGRQKMRWNSLLRSIWRTVRTAYWRKWSQAMRMDLCSRTRMHLRCGIMNCLFCTVLPSSLNLLMQLKCELAAYSPTMLQMQSFFTKMRCEISLSRVSREKRLKAGISQSSRGAFSFLRELLSWQPRRLTRRQMSQEVAMNFIIWMRSSLNCISNLQKYSSVFLNTSFTLQHVILMCACSPRSRNRCSTCTMSQKLPSVSQRYFGFTNSHSFSLSLMILSIVILRLCLEGEAWAREGEGGEGGSSDLEGWMRMNFMQQQNSQMEVSCAPSSCSKKLLILELKSEGMTRLRLFWSSNIMRALRSLSFMLLIRLLKLRIVSLQNRSVFMRFSEDRLDFSSLRSSVIRRISFGRQQFRISLKLLSQSFFYFQCSSACTPNGFYLLRFETQSSSARSHCSEGFLLSQLVSWFSSQMINLSLRYSVYELSSEFSFTKSFSFWTRASPLGFLTTRRRLATRLTSFCLMLSPRTGCSSSFLQISSRMISRFFSKGLQQRKAREACRQCVRFMTAQKLMWSYLQNCSVSSSCSFFWIFIENLKRERMPAQVTSSRPSLRLKLDSPSNYGSKYSKWLVSERLRETSGGSSAGLQSLEEEQSEERELSRREGWLLALRVGFSTNWFSSSWVSLRRKVLSSASSLSLTHSRTSSSCSCSTTSSFVCIDLEMQWVTGSIFSYCCERLLSFFASASCINSSSPATSSASPALVDFFSECLRCSFGLRTISDSQLNETGVISSISSITFALPSWKSFARFLSVILSGFFLSFCSGLLNLVRSTGRKVAFSSLLDGLYLEILAERVWIDFTIGLFEFLSELCNSFFYSAAEASSFWLPWRLCESERLRKRLKEVFLMSKLFWWLGLSLRKASRESKFFLSWLTQSLRFSSAALAMRVLMQKRQRLMASASSRLFPSALWMLHLRYSTFSRCGWFFTLPQCLIDSSQLLSASANSFSSNYSLAWMRQSMCSPFLCTCSRRQVSAKNPTQALIKASGSCRRTSMSLKLFFSRQQLITTFSSSSQLSSLVTGNLGISPQRNSRIVSAFRDSDSLFLEISSSARSYFDLKEASSKALLFLLRKMGSHSSTAPRSEGSLCGCSPESRNLGMDLSRGGWESLCFSLRIGLLLLLINSKLI